MLLLFPDEAVDHIMRDLRHSEQRYDQYERGRVDERRHGEADMIIPVAQARTNETRKNIDVTPVLKKLRNQKVPVYAIYGKQDGLYSKEQIAGLSRITGKSRLVYLDNCSHTCFVDQQAQFIAALKSWLK